MHVDEFIDELLHAERVCDVILPRLQVSAYLFLLFKKENYKILHPLLRIKHAVSSRCSS